MGNINFYRCFSPNLYKFIVSCGQKPMFKAQHENGKFFWVFKETDELSHILIAWKKNNPNK